MKIIKYIIVMFLFILFSSNAFAQTNVSGSISTNTTWSATGSPYIITDNVTINGGITLTINSDVIVRFNSGRRMYVIGTLNATSATFTSYRNVTGSTPSSGDWQSIEIGSSNNSGNATLTNCQISYGYRNLILIRGSLTISGGTISNSGYRNIEVQNGTLNIDNASIYYDQPTTSNLYNLFSDGGSSVITINKTDIYNAQNNVYLSNNGSVTISNSNIYNSSYQSNFTNLRIDSDIVQVTSSEIYNAQTNIRTYGGKLTLENTKVHNTAKNGTGLITSSSSSEIIVKGGNSFTSLEWPISYELPGNITYQGTNTFSDNSRNAILINFYGTNGGTAYNLVFETSSIPYYFNVDFTIPSNSSLIIKSNNIIKFAQYSGLSVDGTFKAEAAAGQKIYFTAITDDNLGGDTNGDGTSSVPASQFWNGITFNNSSKDDSCTIRRIEIKYAGYYNNGAINIKDSSPTIDNNTISNSYYGVKIEGVSNPVISNNVISVSGTVPVAMSVSSDPKILNDSISTQSINYIAIGLLGGTLTSDALIKFRSFTNTANVTYVLLGEIIVPSGKILTINKGTVIKAFDGYGKFQIQGKLIAEGTPDSMIVFTSVKDDNYGNPKDTNKDGNQSSPQVRNWGGMVFTSTADSTSILNYCIMKYGQNDNYSPGGEITIINSHPKISNCQISDAEYGIIAAVSARPRILNTSIINISQVPIALSVSSDPEMTGNKFINAGLTALGLIGENVGINGGIKKRNVAGYENITYVLLNNLTINSGAKLNIEPGITIKVQLGKSFIINGGFKAQGTDPDGKIIFTSIKDDEFGNPGDTNGDGNKTIPANRDWGVIIFRGASDDEYSLIESCIIKYTGYNYNSGTGYYNYGAVNYEDSGSKIKNTTISNSNYGIEIRGSSTTSAENVVIQNCVWDPIGLSLRSDPEFKNITFLSNAGNGLALLEGVLTSNARLKKRDVAGIKNIAYTVANLTIEKNAVLTIDPGVVIKFNAQYQRDQFIAVKGSLIAQGTRDEKIVFTSIKDDSRGGDSNNDGNNSVPQKGDWCTIQFENTSMDSLNTLKNTEIRYGGYKNGDLSTLGIVRIYDSKVIIDSCDLSHSSSSGIGIYGSAYPVITNSKLTNIDLTPISMSMFSNPTFSNNTISNVGTIALGIVPETYAISAKIPRRNFAGFDNITYFYYYYPNNLPIINSGTTITIPAGIVFKNARFEVQGAIIVEGSTTEKVVFTDYRDDEYGNPRDTNNDGTASLPAIDSKPCWLNFYDVSNDSLCSVNNTIFRFVNVPISVNNASPKIRDCIFDKNNWGVALWGNSAPALDNCVFNNLNYTPIVTSIISYPRSTIGNLITGSTYRAIGFLGETLVQDYTLKNRNFAGINNIPYYFPEDYTIGTGVTLTINPGVILKFNDQKNITVKNGLIAIGGARPDSSIVFTHIYDDFYGGDTNADSSKTSSDINYNWDGRYKWWSGITFADESLDPQCILKNVIVRYAGYVYWGGAKQAGIIINSASPTITNSVIKDNRIGILVNGSSNPVINYCDIYNNAEFGIQNASAAFTIDARYNWWGDNLGPNHSSNPAGTGDKISDKVNFSSAFSGGTFNPVPGDVSLNGKIQAFDASVLLKYVVNPTGTDSLNSIQKNVADLDNNKLIQAYDASLILQYVVGKISVFPVETDRLKKDSKEFYQLQNILALQKVETGQILISNSEVNHGESIDIPVRISNLRGMTALQLSLKYETSYMTISSIKPTGIASAMTFAFYNDTEKGVLTIALAGDEVIPDEGDILLLTVNIPEGIKGSLLTSLKIEQCFVNATDLTKFAVSGKIQIKGIPIQYGLLQNYPNPFNPSTTIRYQIPDDNVQVTISIYNSAGQLIKTLINENHRAGEFEVIWDGTNNSGVRVSSGLYIYQMRCGNKFNQAKKLLLVK